MIVRDTIEAFRPAYVLLVGVAGGLGGVGRGDVVVADRIFGYEYGMVASGFYPRPDWNHPTDTAVVNRAHLMKSTEPGWSDRMVVGGPVPSGWRPQIHVGGVASGNKVVEDLSDPSFRPVLEFWPTLKAVEMEGLGAAEAIKNARERGHVVNFAMIRGISDLPGVRASRRRVHPAWGASPKTRERDRWKAVAAEAAAVLAVQMIRRKWSRLPR